MNVDGQMNDNLMRGIVNKASGAARQIGSILLGPL